MMHKQQDFEENWSIHTKDTRRAETNPN